MENRDSVNQTTGWSDRKFGLFVFVLMSGFFLAMIAFYDLAHWGQIKARNACEAVPGQMYIWGDYGRPSGCVKEIQNGQ